MRLYPLVLGAVLALAAPAAAQRGDSTEFFGLDNRESNVPSYFVHARPGQQVMTVYVWGAVRTPGVYLLSAGTDLGELLSLAGGPNLPAVDEDVTRRLTVRHYHVEGGRRTLAYEAAVAAMVREPERYPALRTGDVLEVELYERRRRTYRDTLNVVGALAGVTLVALQVADLIFGLRN